MPKKFRTPSPALLVAALALTVAMIGTAVAADPVAKLNAKKVRKIANQVIDKRAAGLSVANAANAVNAADAGRLGGTPAAGYAKAAIEPYHEIGAAGEPPFENAFVNTGAPFATAAFAKDSLGVVHLRGAIGRPGGGNGMIAFTLPPGYRPAAQLLMPVAVFGPRFGNLFVRPDGAVLPYCDPPPSCAALGLDGVTFIAGR